MTTGERIKAARLRANMTQEKLAAKLNTSYVVISQYENGKRNPKLETIIKIADALYEDNPIPQSGVGNYADNSFWPDNDLR